MIVRSRLRAGLAASVVACLTACAGTNSTPERVVLPPGTSFAAVTDSLVAHGIVAHPKSFKLLARLRGVDREIRAGVYEFAPALSGWQVLDILATGKVVAMRLTVPEGLTAEEISSLAAEKLGLSRDSMLAAARDGAAARRILGDSVPSFEGFLRPETYLLPVGIEPAELVAVMARGFQTGWKAEWTARLDTLKMSRLELVTLASIIEGEARVDEERETIAGVYHNRLRIGMALQADPTVQYAIALKTGKRKPRLFTRDYQFRSPYNTYLHPGLPPGPVNSPGRRSVEAALYPAAVPYLYFVARPDGRHMFSRTYQEHLRAISQARRLASQQP
jgi:UPF0755 protein